jgi:hypothetical protein
MDKTLTLENATVGIAIVCKDHPEWGTRILDKDRNGWTVRGPRGEHMLDEGEFHFWALA